MQYSQFFCDPDGKPSIKRVLLVGWFAFLCCIPLWGQIGQLHVYIFALLLGAKSAESIQYMRK